jgi:SAM-dependent methyltransferase
MFGVPESELDSWRADLDVVDLGCGTGTSAWLARRVHAVGVDPRRQLDTAR